MSGLSRTKAEDKTAETGKVPRSQKGSAEGDNEGNDKSPSLLRRFQTFMGGSRPSSTYSANGTKSTRSSKNTPAPTPVVAEQSEVSADDSALSRVFVCGDNGKRQLGLSPRNNGHTLKLTELKKFKNKKLIHLACGWESTFLVSDEGGMWGMGSNEQRSVVPVGEDCGDDDENSKTIGIHRMEFIQNAVRWVSASENFSVIVTESGTALAYGVNQFGQFGLGNQIALDLKPKPPTNVRLQFSNPICQVAAGHDFMLVLTRTGELFSCGNGVNGCLGLSNPDESKEVLESTSHLTRLPVLAGLPIQQVAAGTMHSLAVTISGELYAWGYNKDGRLGIPTKEKKLKKKAKEKTALEHRLSHLASFSDVVERTTPSTDKSQSDSDDSIIQSRTSLIVSYPSSISTKLPVKLVAAGSAHSAILLQGGTLELAGMNDRGQCGLSPREYPVVKKFTRLITSQVFELGHAASVDMGFDSRTSLGWIFVACGHQHTLAITANGKPFGFGRNSEGQLGTGTRIDMDRPIELKAPSDHFTYFCAAGAYHSILATVRASGTMTSNPSASSDISTLTRVESSAEVSLPLVRLTSDVRSLKAKDHKRIKVSGYSAPYATDIEIKFWKPKLFTEFHSGYSAEELTDLVRETKTTENYTALTQVLLPLFSNPSRLNCSFLLPSRHPQLDVCGLEVFYTELFSLRNEFTNKCTSDLSVAMHQGLSELMKVTGSLKCADQLRCLIIILHCPIFGRSTVETHPVLSLVFRFITLMPCSARAMVVNTLTNFYSADLFEKRMLHHTKQFIRQTLVTAICEPIMKIVALWDGILFMQMLFVASEYCSRELKFEESELRASKVPVQNFALDFLPDFVNPPAEFKIIQQAIEKSVAAANITADPISAPGGPQSRPPQEEPSRAAETTSQSHPELGPASATESTSSGLAEWMCDPFSVLKVEGPVEEKYRFFYAHMFCCPLAFKRGVIHEEFIVKQRNYQLKSLISGEQPFFHIVVRRDHLHEDALNQVVSRAGPAMLNPLRVTFYGEEGMDEGGLRREFFRLVTKKVFDPLYGMFVYNQDTRLTWFSDKSIDADQQYFFVGCLLGLALYNDVLMDLRFPLLVYKKLVCSNAVLSVTDLAEIEPEIAKSFILLLEPQKMSDEEFEAAYGCQTFSVTKDFFGQSIEIDLISEGSTIQLTKENSTLFVEKAVDYYLNVAIKDAFDAFQRGLLCLCRSPLFKTLTATELKQLICGVPQLNFEELKEGAQYFGFKDTDVYIQWLWDILFSLTDHLKKKFLYFCTGNDRVPVGGFGRLNLKIEINGTEPTTRLPTSHTCFNHLLLPRYGSKEKLQRLLTQAIEYSEGFGLQ